MYIRTFQAANLQAALAEIREQMGTDATVLHTRQVKDGWMGWLGRTQVEVTAGLRTENNQPSLAGQAPSESLPRPEAEQLRELLIREGVSDAVAERWTRRSIETLRVEHGGQAMAFSSMALQNALQRVVAADIECGAPIRALPNERRVIALVGPTGVGKTTTVAKLAAGFRIQQKRRVGLLTIDTYRIAAVHQLQAYADIMDLPMQVVERPDQMQAGLKALGDVDLVLIDTAGRNPHFTARIEQLRALLAAAAPDETHLVLSATSSASTTAGVLKGFASVKPTAAILTKMDESEQTAGVLSAFYEQNAPPLSYLTTGQQVPDDIEVGNRDRIVKALLGRPQAPAIAA
ncbi:Flagellar biosynthesis protein FlhF [Roseimaritima multifibrata]|uniref:Flagellar biosynthesis protein FlhF n=1 Tax=Roseimaritima multifibrata TaxID=1930274 RepID=A0A517MLM9_9BACT|nr:flagellar biosynthesis protein FlhF [Roseimaritima multifibrata]QDS95794.1 Flagellar biosynthesis protein FlhF [Roseimaritima multifibrata]